MRRWDKLNDKQRQVLDRVAAGDHLDQPGDSVARHSARALADRGLITIDKSGGQWHATITDAGRFYLEHGRHPDDPAFQDKPADSNRVSARSHRSARPAGPSPAKTDGRPSAEAVRERRRQVVQGWLEELEGHNQIFLKLNDQELREFRRTLAFAKREHFAPAGKTFGQYRVNDGRICVHLIKAQPSATAPSAPPIPVPDKVRHLHPLLADPAEPHTTLGVSKAAAPRALRIMHALLSEAERRGYEMAWADDRNDGLEIRVSGHPQTVRMEEEHDHREVLPTADELQQQKTYAWQRVSPRPADLPSGRLVLKVGGNAIYRGQRRWADRKRWTLEDKLGEVLAAVEAQAAEQEGRRRADEERRRDRRHRWEQAMASAREKFRTERRADALRGQVERWELAERVRRYRDVAAQAADIDDDWLSWMTTYADQIDPINSPICGPEDVEPSSLHLRPYLGRWSPYGPE